MAKAKRRATAEEVHKLFLAWPVDEQNKLLKLLRIEMELERQGAAMIASQKQRQFRALEANWKAKIPKKHGKPERDALILRKCDKMSDGEIANDKEVIAANGGKKMRPTAVQGVRRRHGKTKEGRDFPQRRDDFPQRH